MLKETFFNLTSSLASPKTKPGKARMEANTSYMRWNRLTNHSEVGHLANQSRVGILSTKISANISTSTLSGKATGVMSHIANGA